MVFSGYILSDAGFDVWLGNFRGNRYSRHHVNASNGVMNPDDPPFWSFSIHELGKGPSMCEVCRVLGFAHHHLGPMHSAVFTQPYLIFGCIPNADVKYG